LHAVLELDEKGRRRRRTRGRTVRVDGARREDELLARDDLGVDTDDHAVGDALHDVRVAALADADDVALLQPNVGLRARRSVRLRQLFLRLREGRGGCRRTTSAPCRCRSNR